MFTLENAAAVRNPLHYLFGAIRNLLVDHHRTRARALRFYEPLEAADEHASSVLDPERIVCGQQRLEIVRAGIEALPPRCRQAMTLHRFSGLSYVEIARQMKISTRTVEKHISEGLLRLSEALQRAESGATERASDRASGSDFQS